MTAAIPPSQKLENQVYRVSPPIHLSPSIALLAWRRCIGAENLQSWGGAGKKYEPDPKVIGEVGMRPCGKWVLGGPGNSVWRTSWYRAWDAGSEVRSGPLGCGHRPSVLGVLHPTAGGRSRRRPLR